MTRPDMNYAENEAPDHEDWFQIVDRTNDLLNYSLGFACAQALSSVIPGSRVMLFPWPEDIPTRDPDPSQRYACVWLREEGEDFTEESRVLSLSGVCSAQEWADGEFLDLEKAAPCETVLPQSDHEASLHRIVVKVASALPWMPDIPGRAYVPVGHNELKNILKKITEGLREIEQGELRAHHSCWAEIERSVPFFASDLDAASLNISTPLVKTHTPRRF